MIKRIELIIQSQNLTPSQFADRIGIQRSGLSHILSGRNNPSLDFVQKVLAAFPDLNPNWFLQGKGRMYDNLAEPESGNNSLFFPPKANVLPAQESLFQEEKEPVSASVPESVSEKVLPPANELKPMQETISAQSSPASSGKTAEQKPRICRILLFYEDGTFEEYTKR